MQKFTVTPARAKALESFAVKMRNAPTDAEYVFQRRIAERLQVEYGLKYIAQYPVFPTPNKGFIVDFYFPAWQLAVEIDGGHHYTKQGRTKDKARSKLLKQRGIRVWRFSNSAINKRCNEIYQRFAARCQPLIVTTSLDTAFDDECDAAFEYAINK